MAVMLIIHVGFWIVFSHKNKFASDGKGNKKMA
jgi:hypothetical protein